MNKRTKDGLIIGAIIIAGIACVIVLFATLGDTRSNKQVDDKSTRLCRTPISGEYYSESEGKCVPITDPREEEWERHREEAEAAREAARQDAMRDNCRIKGNINYNTGAKIYHVPGQQYYDSTEINEAYGEMWFCSEDEAIQAGWRRSEI